MDPSVHSLKSPRSSAPQSSLCMEAPTKNMLGFSFSFTPIPGPNCSTSSSAPGRNYRMNNNTSNKGRWFEGRRRSSTPPFCCRSLILLSSQVMASSLVSEASSSTTRGANLEPLLSTDDSCSIVPPPRKPAWQKWKQIHCCCPDFLESQVWNTAQTAVEQALLWTTKSNYCYCQ